MTPDLDASFPVRFKAIVDRICASEELNRVELAASLGIQVSVLSTAAYRGEIGFELVEKVAHRAGCAWEEIDAIEMAWLRMQATRPRKEALRRALRRIDEKEEHFASIVEFAENEGFGPQLQRFLARKRVAVVAGRR